ncbi:MmgE/PrpD family protein [Nesterenkonia suensis]
MDEVLESIVEFSVDHRVEDMPDDVVNRAREIWIDSLACAAGGRKARGAAVAERYAVGAPERDQGFLIGHSELVCAEAAAFGNTSMIRDLDMNDGLAGGHPSDMIGALMSVGAERSVSVGDLLASIAVAYEVYARISDYVYGEGFFPENRRVQPLSVDQGLYVCVGATAGLCRLLGLTRGQAAHALSLSVSAGFPLRTSRAGELSDLKGMATAISSRNAMFFCHLAREGITAPGRPFEGRHGLVELLTGSEGPMELEPLGGEWAIRRTALKYFQTTSNCQVAVWAALRLRDQVNVEQVSSIEVFAPRFLAHESGSEGSKWNPATRETADHSLPYVFCKALRDGVLTFDEFDADGRADEAVVELASRLSVEVDHDIDASWPETFAVRVRITEEDGSVREHYEQDPRGVPQNPLTRSDLRDKFVALVGDSLVDNSGSSLFDSLWGASQGVAVSDLMAGFTFRP